MVKLFKVHYLKYIYSYRLGAIASIITLSAILYSIAVLNFTKDISFDIFQKNFLLSFFSQIILPIGAIIITSLEIGEDLESGCGKFFLISKISKVKYFLAKILFILTIMILTTTFTYLITAFLGLFIFNNSTIDSLVLQGVIKTLIALVSIILLTAIIALITSNFQNTLMISIGIYLSLLIIDQVFPTLQFTLTYNITNPLNTNGVGYPMDLAYSLCLLLISMKIMKEKDVVL